MMKVHFIALKVHFIASKAHFQLFVPAIGPVAVWCRSFDSVMCSKGDDSWAQEEQTNSVRMRCELH